VLELDEAGAQRRLGPAREDDFEPRLQRRARPDRPQQVDGRGRCPLVSRQPLDHRPVLPHAADAQMLHRREDQVLFGGVVVHLGTPRHPRPAHQLGGARAGPPQLDQAVDGGVQQPRPGGGAALGLGAGALMLRRNRGHAVTIEHQLHTVKPVCNWHGADGTLRRLPGAPGVA
jgi:hypothetical protein